jgi:uncharacterized protein (TIGR02246 family)
MPIRCAAEEKGNGVMTYIVRRRWLAICFVSIALLGASPALAADDVRSDIEAANKKWEAAASRSDGPGVAALYTNNAQLLPAQSDFVTGTEAIGQFWQAVFDSGIKGASLVTVEVESHGDTAYEVGKFELRGADGNVLDHGKYVVIWKKDGTSWKLHRDIWTTSVAPAKQ